MDAVLSLIVALALISAAVAALLVGERGRPRRRATDPRTRDRIASLLDRTP